MRNLLKLLTINDFIPPIFHRVSRKIKIKLKLKRQPPFDSIPESVKPLWLLDVGANVGDVTKAALETYPDCKAICFEPVAETFDTLKRHLQKFDGRCTFFNMALSVNNEEGEINITSFHGSNSILPQSQLHKQLTGTSEISKQKIRLVRLDDICSQFPSQKIDIMKIDVEGFELNVLKGGFNFISNHVDIIIIEMSLYRNDSIADNNVGDMYLFMKEAGFSLINVYDIAYIKDHPTLMVGQMDCVFRNNKNL